MGLPNMKKYSDKMSIESEVGKGTKVKAFFRTDHLDFIPVGDMTSTIMTLITMNETTDFVYTRRINEKSFTLDTKALREILGDVPFGEPTISAWLRDYIEENTKQLTEV